MKVKKIVLIGLLSLFCLTGCKKEKTEVPKEKEQQQEIEQGKLKLESDSTKYVVAISDTSKYVFYYEGDTVTDFEIYIDEKTNENANKELDSYKEIYETEEHVEKIMVRDIYIVINYDNEYIESEYGTTSLNEIIKFYK